MAKKRKIRSNALNKHRAKFEEAKQREATRTKISLGRVIFEYAEALGVEPETLADNDEKRKAIKAYEDAEFEKYEQQMA